MLAGQIQEKIVRWLGAWYTGYVRPAKTYIAVFLFVFCVILIGTIITILRMRKASETQLPANAPFLSSSDTVSSVSEKEKVSKEITMVSPNGKSSFVFPEGSFTDERTLQASVVAGCAIPEGTWRSAGVQASIQTMQGKHTPPLTDFTIQMKYDRAGLLHLDENTLTIFACPDTTNPTFSRPLISVLDKENTEVSAQSGEFGKYGLLASLACPADIKEPYDDQYKIHGGQDVRFAVPSHDLFDNAKDVDWYGFDAKKGKTYVIRTQNVAEGVDTVVTLTDTVTTLKTNNRVSPQKAGSIIQWTAPYDQFIQFTVTPSSISKTGCDATYDVLVIQL